MPHIAITMYPGRDEATKKALAVKMQEAMAEELKLEKKYISVSIEDIEKDRWDDNMKKILDDTIFIRPDL